MYIAFLFVNLGSVVGLGVSWGQLLPSGKRSKGYPKSHPPMVEETLSKAPYSFGYLFSGSVSVHLFPLFVILLADLSILLHDSFT